MIEFLMPSLGADMEAGTLVEWRKRPGDFVKRGDIIADVETQKGLIEIEVFDEGVIGELLHDMITPSTYFCSVGTQWLAPDWKFK